MIDKPIDLLAQIEVAFDGSGSDAEHGAWIADLIQFKLVVDRSGYFRDIVDIV